MSFLLKKSEQNKGAFAFLSERGLYTAAVHCGYYSCIQKIVYILKDYFTEEYKAELAQIQGGYGNRHKMYIKLFSEMCCKDMHERRELKTKLTELKDLRIQADYEDIEVTEDKIKKVEQYMTQVQRLTRKNLNI